MNNTPAFSVAPGNLEAFLQGVEELDPNGKSVHGISENDVLDPITKVSIQDQPEPKVISEEAIRRALKVPYKDYSDIKITEQQMEALRNPNFKPSPVVDLDTSTTLVDFYKTANANMLNFENLFNTDLKSQAELAQIKQ